MLVYSLYIFDKHCECVYYQEFAKKRHSKLPEHLMAGVARPPTSPTVQPPNQRLSTISNSGTVIAQSAPSGSTMQTSPEQQLTTSSYTKKALPFDEEAKLVYGVVFSLRNIIKRMAGREEPFISYKTSTYKLHFYEVLSGYKFVLLSEVTIDSLRFLLKQIYQTAFQDHVVLNPFLKMDSRASKRGIDSDGLRKAIEQIVSTVESK